MPKRPAYRRIRSAAAGYDDTAPPDTLKEKPYLTGALRRDHILYLGKSTNSSGVPLVHRYGRSITLPRLFWARAYHLSPGQRLRRDPLCTYPRCFSHWYPSGRQHGEQLYQQKRAIRRMVKRMVLNLQTAPHWRPGDPTYAQFLDCARVTTDDIVIFGSRP